MLKDRFLTQSSDMRRKLQKLIQNPGVSLKDVNHSQYSLLQLGSGEARVQEKEKREELKTSSKI